MKKMLLIALLMISMQTFAQKTFEVHNWSSNTVVIYDIFTKPAAGMYPEFHSKPFGGIAILPGGSYILENILYTYRFPFESPLSMPYINLWERLDSASSGTNMPSNAAWTLGNNQVYKGMIFEVGNTWNNFSPISPTDIYLGSGFGVLYDYSNPDIDVHRYVNIII